MSLLGHECRCQRSAVSKHNVPSCDSGHRGHLTCNRASSLPRIQIDRKLVQKIRGIHVKTTVLAVRTLDQATGYAFLDQTVDHDTCENSEILARDLEPARRGIKFNFGPSEVLGNHSNNSLRKPRN